MIWLIVQAGEKDSYASLHLPDSLHRTTRVRLRLPDFARLASGIFLTSLLERVVFQRSAPCTKRECRVSRKGAKHVLSPSAESILSGVEGLRINSVEGVAKSKGN
jgi:hypothetical protein